jgi:hypothetical protein
MSTLVAGIGLLLAIILHVNQVPQSDIFLAFNAATSDNPQLWAGLTFLGDTAVMLCVMAPLLLIHPNMWMGVLAAIPAGGMTSLALKWLFDAPRPADVLALTDFHVVGSVLRGHSFPSGTPSPHLQRRVWCVLVYGWSTGKILQTLAIALRVLKQVMQI